MFFTEQEKKIYQPPGRGEKHDPIHVDRTLVVATRNRLNEMVSSRNAWKEDTGDVSPEGKNHTAVLGASAELELAVAARVAFNLPPFPECTDAEALEILYDFLGWMEGKGEAAGTPSTNLTQPRGTKPTYPGS